MNTSRRSLMTMLMLASCFAAAGPFLVSPAEAKDGDSGGSGGSGGGGSSGGSSDSGSSGSGSSGSSGSGSSGSNSGSGSSNSGSGRGRGRGGDDDDGNDDDDSGGGSGDSGRGRGRSSDSDRARDAVREGRILPLKTVLERIDAKRYGRVIDVNLRRSMFSDVYQVKVRDGAGAIRTLRVNARNGVLLGG
ncbi:hypothetical protein JNB88_01975 [Rhizobium cauense]|uniref:PepSY domain-containing protein n=1 Tax=Rhizobium cauense TaxID=1166683 RepID=UPI001C6E5C67|nr:hypothetical protein [Rhizobium cauense]MBW9112417.1 hypothetical protein [Rhizobium cauense]